jgi:exodeoxyribonuclease V alpha subunit
MAGASQLDPELFQPIDRHFALFLERLAGGPQPALALAAGLLSRSRGEGHTCLDLRRASDPEFATELLGAPLPAPVPELTGWLNQLRQSPVVGRPGEFKPLILDSKGRLYLERFWAAESELATAILERAREPVPHIDEARLQEGLRRFFPGGEDVVSDAQALAAATAVRRRLTVISGGPGTGKTRTVAMVLALILEQSGADPCRIALAAPTGKAAARLQESIRKQAPSLDCSEAIREALPREAFTMHRLLGVSADSARRRFDALNPLPFEVVVLDEASMVDLPMMAGLFAALLPTARLILLGDQDQLASVEAGAVLGDLCLGAGQSGALADSIVRLEKNYRFGPNHGLLALSRAVNAGDADGAFQTLHAGKDQGLSWSPLPPVARLAFALRSWVLDAFRDAVAASEPGAALAALARTRLLVALRLGPYGLERVNELAEQILIEAGLIDATQRWYSGRPILITRNDYALGLFNGDVGMLWSPGPAEETRAWFLDGAGELRSYSPVRLPEHETVFAMTVHKSQGSEFENVLLLLPDHLSPVVTRELIYTGITRARSRLELWAPESIFRAAIARRAERPSGLREALWGDPPRPGSPAPPRPANQLEFGLDLSSLPSTIARPRTGRRRF